MSKCGLCKKEAPLRKSHYFPKAFYKILKNRYGEQYNGLLLSDGDSINYNDYQVKRSFLCSDCEERFNKYGENTITKECCRSNSFILLEKIQSINDDFSLLGDRWVLPHKDINKDAYIYFSLSIVWRASEGEWSGKLSDLSKSLKKDEELQIRNYLLGLSECPKSICILVYADNDIIKFPLMGFPVLEKKEESRVYRFQIPGIRFRVEISNGNDGYLLNRLDSPVFNTNILFSESSFLNSWEYQGIIQTLMNKVEPKGRLKEKIITHGKKTDK